MNTPANPTLYRKKWGLRGYSLFPYICYKKCGYSFKPPQRGGYWGVSNVYPQLMIWREIRKVSNFSSENPLRQNAMYLNRYVFLIRKKWGLLGVHYFLISALKFRLWVLKCKISDLIGQTWRIRSNTSQMWTVWPNRQSYLIFSRIHYMWKIRPNFSHLYSKIMSRVKYSTDYVKREKFNDILHGCRKIDLIRTSCDLLDRKRHMWKVRPNFSHLYSPKVCCLFYIWPNIAHVSNSIEFFTAVKNVRRIRHSHDIFDRIHHMWKIRPNFSHLYLPKISNVKFRLNMSNMRNMIEYFTDGNNLTKFVKVITYSAEYITCEKFDRISLAYIRRKYHM